jgi:hypothetical protein
MANYRKSFNLRNGVQVDDKNFIVNANGLVGIGTSSPIEILDVRGNARIIGLLTATSISVPNIQVTGIATFGTITDGTVKISSGIITGITTSGIVTYYGDGSGLINIPTSQWVDINPGFGVTSIYAIGRVGIGTTNPIQPYVLHIGGNPDSTVGPNTGGVGINSTGNIKASGIITASTYFNGSIIGDINSTGISTITNIRVGLGTTAATLITSGVITSIQFNGQNANLSGIVTVGLVTAGFVTATTFFGGLVGIASTALSLAGNPSIGVGTVTAIEVRTGLSTVGIITVITELDIGLGGTSFTATNNARVGIGTSIPTSQLQIRRSTAPLFEIISNTGVSTISVGQSVGVGRSTGVIRFGSASRTLDILNNDTGDFNFYLHAGQSGINTGRFGWIYGQTNTELATLTYDGRFGIGITNPSDDLHVVGTSTVTGNANFGSNVTVVGNISAASFTLPSIVNNTNLNNSSGVSTFNDLKVSGSIAITGIGSIGIGTDFPAVGVDARIDDGLFARIGISTTTFATELLNVNGSAVFSGIGIGSTASTIGIGIVLAKEFEQYNSRTRLVNSDFYVSGNGAVGVGTTSVRCALDFADGGKSFSSGQFAFMMVPKLTTAQRSGLSTGIGYSGAVIYNTNTSKFQGWTGIAWTDFN